MQQKFDNTLRITFALITGENNFTVNELFDERRH